MIDLGVSYMDEAGIRDSQRLSGAFRAPVQGYASEGYAGAEVGGYNANWSPYARHADQELERYLQFLWARSYEQHRNNVIVYGPTEVLAEAVGELFPTSLAERPEDRKILQETWGEWGEQAGSDGVSTWGDICERLVGSACQGGDAGVSYENRPELGGPHGLRLNLFDAYTISSPFDTANETTRFGVVYNQGAEVAYYVRKTDSSTGDRKDFYRFERVRNGQPNFTLFRRPDASRRPQQSRCPPIVTPVLNEVKELADYRQAMVRGATKRSRVTLILKSPDPTAVIGAFQKAREFDAIDPDIANAIRTNNRPNAVTTRDATTYNIPNYVDVQNTPLDTVDTAYPTYVIANLQLAAGAFQLPFEVAYQIWQDASFARARILTLRSGATARRWQKKMTPVANNAWRIHVQNTLAKYKSLRLRENPSLYRVRWHGRAQEYQDFLKEVSAEAEGRSSGVLSPQSAARRTGSDAFQILRESAEYVAERRKVMAEFEISEEEWAATYGPVKEKPQAKPGQATEPEEPAP